MRTPDIASQTLLCGQTNAQVEPCSKQLPNCMEEETSKHRPSLPLWGQTTPLILCKCSACSWYCGIIIPISQPAFCRCPHLHCVRVGYEGSLLGRTRGPNHAPHIYMWM